jgi:hypothetical protein
MARDETPGAVVLDRLELDGSGANVLVRLTISNGIGRSPDRTELCLCESGTGTTAAFGVDPIAGGLFRVDGLGTSGPSCAPYRGRTSPVEPPV